MPAQATFAQVNELSTRRQDSSRALLLALSRAVGADLRPFRFVAVPAVS
jgi:hypothetical protein